MNQSFLAGYVEHTQDLRREDLIPFSVNGRKYSILGSIPVFNSVPWWSRMVYS